MSGPLRLLLTERDDAPLLTFEAAQEEFRSLWKKSREAHVDLMAHVAGHWVRLLHATGRPIEPTEIRLVRREAQAIADKALALVAALDEADRIAGRYRRGTATTREEPTDG